jgi:hypothetical protein
MSTGGTDSFELGAPCTSPQLPIVCSTPHLYAASRSSKKGCSTSQPHTSPGVLPPPAPPTPLPTTPHTPACSADSAAGLRAAAAGCRPAACALSTPHQVAAACSAAMRGSGARVVRPKACCSTRYSRDGAAAGCCCCAGAGGAVAISWAPPHVAARDPAASSASSWCSVLQGSSGDRQKNNCQNYDTRNLEAPMRRMLKQH